jgi:hypothetical protein
MALDRTWFNTLVDDDGSGLTGSVWDKADVDSLMDAVDAEIARIQPESFPWTPFLQAAGGGTALYASQSAVYARSGKLLTVAGYVELSSKGSLSGALRLTMPSAAAAISANGAIVLSYWAGLAIAVGGIQGYFSSGTNVINLVALPAGGSTAIGFLDASQVGNTFTFAFGGSYVLL